MQKDTQQFNSEKAFTLIQQQLKTIIDLQSVQQSTLSEHTGTLAEILVTVKRLDEERLVEHHRLTEVIHQVQQLKVA